MAATAESTARDPRSASEASAEPVNGRYRLVRPLGKGGMGSVYLAVDTQAGDLLVALKRVRRDKLDRQTVAILRNEFTALAALRHPNLTRAYEFGIENVTGDLFFTSEFVNGVTWTQATQKLALGETKGLEAFLGLTVQVLRGLEFIHSQSYVHSDIKPENILVYAEAAGADREDTPLGVKIIDFGLVKREGVSGGKKILGTPYYVAPETILGSQIDRRTDLYSLGVVLYHLVTGAPPFRGSSNIEILKCHVEKEASPPHEARRNLPPELSEVILRLMAKKPQDRHQSALEVVEHLNSVLHLGFPLETPETARSYLEPARLSGRDAEVSGLQNMFERVTTGKADGGAADREVKGEDPAASEEARPPQPVDSAVDDFRVPKGRLVVLRGEKGLQKRRIVEDLRCRAQASGSNFYDISCKEGRSAGGSFERLLADVAGMEELRGKAGGLAYLDKGILLVQRLQDARGGGVEGYEQIIDEISAAALTCSQGRGIVICLHDLHEAQRPTLRLVDSLLHAALENRVQRSKILVVATALDRGELEENAFGELCATPQYRTGVTELQLKRLGDAEVAALVSRAFRNLEMPPAFVQRIVEESDGNTDVVIEILRYLLDRGRILRTAGGWQLGSDLESEDLPGKVRRELKDRIAHLPPEALRLAIAFACLDEACDLDAAVQLSGINSRSVFQSLEALRSARILQACGPEHRAGVYDFVHSSARSMLYKAVPADELPALHQKAGELYEARNSASSKENTRILAHHFLKSSNREKAIRYGLDAAQDLANDFAPVQAIEMYQRVLESAGSVDRVLQFKVEREIARLRLQIGDYQSVLTLLDVSRLPAEIKRSERVSVYLQAARAHARLGKFDEATAFLNRSLRSDKNQESAGDLASIMLGLAELHSLKGNVVECLRCCTRLIKSKCEIKDPEILSQLYMLLAESQAQLNNMDGAVSYCQMALRIVEPRHEPRFLAWGLFCRGKYHAYRRQFQKALRQFQLCLLLRRKTSELDGQADCLREIGTLHYLLGNQLEARANLMEALELYEKTGNLSQTVQVLSTLAEVCRQLGEYDASQEAVDGVLCKMEPLDKRCYTLRTLLTLAGVAIDKGELQNARRHLDEAERVGTAGRGSSIGLLGIYPLLSELALYNGDLGGALDRAAQGALAAREAQDPVALAWITVQQAYLLCRLGRPAEARRSLLTVMDAGRSHDLPVLNGWARLIEGMVLTDEGKLEQAERVFSEATEILTAKGSARDLAYLYLEHGLLALKRGEQEQAYLNFEEGLHISEKLQLSYLKCRYFFATAALEATIGGVEASRAEKNLVFAESVAGQAPYPEILWQVRYQLGKLFLATKRYHEAEVRFRHATSGISAILRKMSPAHAQSYRRATGAKDIENMIDGCKFAAIPSVMLKGMK
jgi:serine/threonine protein kinase/tetratricopeptide (TPR) repeat protein